jgi:hypothetical protein
MTTPNDDAKRLPASAGDSARKPYAAPTLRVYGDVAALTRSIANTSTNADGGHGAMSKTS